MACEEEVPVVTTAVFAQDTQQGATEHIAKLGPYKCPYDLYVAGHIDDTFLIEEKNGNTIRGSRHAHNVKGKIYRLLPNTEIDVYALDIPGTYLSWELCDTGGGHNAEPIAPIMYLSRANTTEPYNNLDLAVSSIEECR